MSGVVFELGLIVVLVFLNGIFSATEIALVTIRRSRLQQMVDEGNTLRGPRPAAEGESGPLPRRDPDRDHVPRLPRVGVRRREPRRRHAGLPRPTSGRSPGLAGSLSLIIVTGLLTIFTIIFGELVPKQIGLAHAERVATTFSRLIEVLGRLFAPLVAFLTLVTRWVSRLFRADVTADERISSEELRLIIEQGGEQGILEAEEEQMIHAVIELGEQRVHEVMIPRTDMVTLSGEATFEEATEADRARRATAGSPSTRTRSTRSSASSTRRTCCRSWSSPNGDRPVLRTLLRTPVFVPESMTVDDLLHELQRRKVHLAIVLDEYGGTAGLVTIEDLIEEIVGEIQDEYDEEEPMIVRLSDDEARVDGRAAVDDLQELFDTTFGLEDEDEYDTVGGLIYHRIGGVPKPGDEVRVDGLLLTVESTDGRRVGKVLVVREGSGENGDAAEEDR